MRQVLPQAAFSAVLTAKLYCDMPALLPPTLTALAAHPGASTADGVPFGCLIELSRLDALMLKATALLPADAATLRRSC
eukprot:3948368-Prymnesium_polylepis.1